MRKVPSDLQPTIELKSWEEFGPKLSQLRNIYEPDERSPFLFRGLANSDWALRTTLERSLNGPKLFSDYYRLIATRIRPAIETFTDRNWAIADYSSELEQSFREYSIDNPLLTQSDVYRYMVYLRHHGFPSPLLDWSHSPYIAAFFAFREHTDDVKKRSIYVFCEQPEGYKGGSYGESKIEGTGKYVRSHRRHFRQHSNYTICSIYKTEWEFASHAEVFARREDEQDILYKIDIPSAERSKVLRSLDEYNLNAYSLFDSEDTLMETLAFRELQQQDRSDPGKASGDTSELTKGSVVSDPPEIAQ